MSDPTSTSQIDLSPLSGKTYFNSIRQWREEFIYFLLVDRFHDDKARTPATSGAARAPGGGTRDTFCGGTLRGVKDHIDYILNLGCTSIWLSPVFENVADPHSFHGYGIQNYLSIDPRFGTKQDLVDLVDAAHQRDMRVFLDVVINHMGDVWLYNPDVDHFYFNDRQFPFGGFRRSDRPVPTELRDPQLFHRRGQIRTGHFDDFPEYEHGDFFSLKDLAHDDTPQGDRLIDILTTAHCYWIREADIDGMRMDAIKHLSQLATARFCSNVREYAYKLGKRTFLTFGELIAGDDSIDGFIGANTSRLDPGGRVFFGIDSVLDFPLYFALPGVIKAMSPPAQVFARYDRQRQRALNEGELGRYLITFLDNHDGVGQPDEGKRRFAADAPDDQVIAGMGFLLCALGTTCIYYGTEQGLSGKGSGDVVLRETLFDLADPTKNFLNQRCRLYQEIAKISNLTDAIGALKYGRMYFREVSGNGRDFGLPQGHPCTLAFSRILADQEALVAYNTSTVAARNDFVIVDAQLQKNRPTMTFRYDSTGKATGTSINVKPHPDPSNPTRLVQLTLDPMQFVVLS
jgi:glycosidase